MKRYLLRRLMLLPLTLFCVILVNFAIINLAPGEPTTAMSVSEMGEATRSSDTDLSMQDEDPYLTFREHYGLTLPLFLNFWPWQSLDSVKKTVNFLAKEKENRGSSISLKEWRKLRAVVGDKARFALKPLLEIASDKAMDPAARKLAVALFIRGGTRQAITGYRLDLAQKTYNRNIAKANLALRSYRVDDTTSLLALEEKVQGLHVWYRQYAQEFPDGRSVATLFFETRFFRYLSRVVTLDFGTLRNDDQKRVIDEVTSRLKYSLTLSVLPLIITTALCLLVGTTMALWHKRWPDTTLNLICLILYAIPIFVVAPFLIEKVALNHHFPLTQTPIPISGFSSGPEKMATLGSWRQLQDIAAHLFLPLVTLIYGALAVHSRLSRTAVLEVLRQDFVRTAKAKGLSTARIVCVHVGRNAAITIVTTVAGSLGVILAGSLIVETLFQIDGFGRFFYEAIINRDYNVMLFSALAGSLLSIAGYLLADLTYAALDPRLTLE